jgi:hypothetical protein
VASRESGSSTPHRGPPASPSGTDVRAHLRGELQQAGLVIELISATFLTRPMCLIELGGAWLLEKSTYPIVVPPLTRTQAVAQIGDVHMGQLTSDDEIDAQEKDDPDEPDRRFGIAALPCDPGGRWEQAELLVVTQGRGGNPGLAGQLTDGQQPIRHLDFKRT